MEGCGEAFRPHLDDSLRRLIYRALAHPNRFIRCAGCAWGATQRAHCGFLCIVAGAGWHTRLDMPPII